MIDSIKAGDLGWQRATITNLETGERMFDVVECNAKEGWLVRRVRGADGGLLKIGDHVVSEVIYGAFDIRIGS